MKKYIYSAYSLVSLSFPVVALAQAATPITMTILLNRINLYILNPIIGLMFAIALLLFFWGIFRFIMHAEGDKEREEGKKNMLWGIVGMFIMVSVFGIIRVILYTFGFDAPDYIDPLLY